MTVEVVPLAEAYDDRLHRLYEAVRDRAVVQFERLTPGFFIALGRAHPSNSFLIRQRGGGRAVGWAAVLVHGDVVYDLFHGIDYEEIARTPLYFGQLAGVVRFAIDRGAGWLSMGQSTAIAKARFGARAVPLWIAIRHESDAVTRMLTAGRRVSSRIRSHRDGVSFGAPRIEERSCATGS